MVVSLLFDLSADASTPLLQSVVENIDRIATPGSITETGALDFAPLISHLASSPLLSYSGSLTTPPCSEDVLWLVMKTPIQVSKEQLASFATVYKNNARPIQPTNGRVIKESR